MKADRTDPALVPTTTSAVRGSQPVASSRARRAPTVQAAPRTPPAPSTRPRRVPAPGCDGGTGGAGGTTLNEEVSSSASRSVIVTRTSPYRPAQPNDPHSRSETIFSTPVVEPTTGVRDADRHGLPFTNCPTRLRPDRGCRSKTGDRVQT